MESHYKQTQKENFMKLLIGLLALTFSLGAFTRENPISSRELSERLEAEIDFTSDNVASIIHEFNKYKSEINIHNHADYAVKAKQFETKAQQALVKFENIVKNKIVRPLAIVMTRYNDVYLSNEYDESQKVNLLKQIKTMNLLPLQKKLNDLYQQEIKKLYYSVVDIPFVMQEDFGKIVFITILTSEKEIAISREKFFSMLNETVLPILTEECYSQSCPSLFASTLTNYLNKISKLMDRDLTIPALADGTTISLKKAKIDPNGIIRLLNFTHILNPLMDRAFDVTHEEYLHLKEIEEIEAQKRDLEKQDGPWYEGLFPFM